MRAHQRRERTLNAPHPDSARQWYECGAGTLVSGSRNWTVRVCGTSECRNWRQRHTRQVPRCRAGRCFSERGPNWAQEVRAGLEWKGIHILMKITRQRRRLAHSHACMLAHVYCGIGFIVHTSGVWLLSPADAACAPSQEVSRMRCLPVLHCFGGECGG
jgi:hypothetical protein